MVKAQPGIGDVARSPSILVYGRNVVTNNHISIIMIVDSGAEISLIPEALTKRLTLFNTKPIPSNYTFSNANGTFIDAVSLVSFDLLDGNGNKISIIDAVVVEGDNVPSNQILCSFPDIVRNGVSINCDGIDGPIVTIRRKQVKMIYSNSKTSINGITCNRKNINTFIIKQSKLEATGQF